MKARLVATVLALTCAAPAAASPLALDDVLDSVAAHHPLLAAARTSLDRAEGARVASDGAFDPRLRVRATDVVSGYYDHTLVDAEVRALTPAMGITPFVGWRLGRGKLPEYDWKYRTLEDGEVRAGVEVPLLAGARIDRARGERRKAQLGLAVASAEVRQRVLEVQRDAALAYIEWTASGHRLRVRAAQLALANDRTAGLERSVSQGNRPPIDLTDQARLVASREAVVVAARRDVRRASLDLSLHYRDAAGNPVTVEPDPLPGLDAPATTPLEQDLEAALRVALAQAPKPEELARRLEIVETELQVARNAVLPSVNVSGAVARGLGPPDPTLPDRSQTSFVVGLSVELPLGMHAARGASEIARADRHRLTAERRFLVDRLRADIAIAQAEVRAARERATLTMRGAELAEELAAAERTRFERGDSNLLVVNLREEASVDAAAVAIDARADVLRARIRLLFLLGEPLTSQR